MSKKMILAGCGLLAMAVFSGAQTMKVFQKVGNPIEIPTANVDSVIFVSSSSGSSSSGGLIVTQINSADWRDIIVYGNASDPTVIPDLYIEVRGEGITGVARFPMTWDATNKQYVGYAHTPKTAIVGPWKLNLISSKTTPFWATDTSSVGIGNITDTLAGYWGVNYSKGADFVDSRESTPRTYQTIIVGSQRWMASNLNYGSKVLGSASQSNNTLVEKYCYGDLDANCTSYGGLYQWAEMMAIPDSCNSKDCSAQVQIKHQGICPTGWHVPTDAEWDTLITALGGSAFAGKRMKLNTTGISGWDNSLWNDGNSGGFSALPVPFRNTFSLSFDNFSSSARFWSASQSAISNAWYRYLNDVDVNVYRKTTYDLDFRYGKNNGFSVRCVMD